MTLIESLCSGVPGAILFDLDVTLADSVPDIGLAIDAMLMELGYPVAGQHGGFLTRVWAAAVGGWGEIRAR